MKKTLLSAIAVGLLAAAPAMAEDGPKGPKAPMTDEQRAAKHAERFAKTDANSDGALSKDEFVASHVERAGKMFDRIDANKDGKVTQDEMKAGHEKMREKMKERWEKRKGDKLKEQAE